MMPLRDGVLLATDLYRNSENTVAPVLVRRTPYNKERFVSPDVPKKRRFALLNA